LSWLRATRKVVDPEGVAWDIYVTRARFGQWTALDIDAGDGFASHRGGLLWLLMVPVLVVVELVLALVRLIVLIPMTFGRAAAKRGLRVEAVADWPQRQRYGWEVPVEARDQVVAEIAAGLRRGSIARPEEAVFLGELE
jgi:hypothetical protein